VGGEEVEGRSKRRLGLCTLRGVMGRRAVGTGEEDRRRAWTPNTPVRCAEEAAGDAKEEGRGGA